MNNYIQPGEIMDFIAPATCASGQGTLVGSLVCIAALPVASGALGQFKTRGVVSHAKLSAQAWTEGQLVYWDNTARLFTTVSTSNKVAGCAAKAAANPSDTGLVRLNGTAS